MDKNTKNKSGMTKRETGWIWWKWEEVYHPLEQTEHPVSLCRKSAQTQKVQKPSGLGGYATSRDKRGSFTQPSPARAICSWWEWVGEGAPGTSRTPRAAENNSMSVWNQHNISREIWKYEHRWAASQHKRPCWRWGLIGRRPASASNTGNENYVQCFSVQQ